MPDSVHTSSSAPSQSLAYPHFASRRYPSQPQAGSLTERPESIATDEPVAGAKGGHAPATRGVVPEKRSLAGALKASGQPAVVGKGQSAEGLCSNGHRSPSRSVPPVKLVQTTSWLDPRVRAELEREATERHLSLSEVVALACRDWVCYEIHRQQTTLFEATQRHIIREEIQRLKDSLIPFTIKNAQASEQTRIVMANVYKRFLKADGVTPQRFYEILDQIDLMAENNIKQRSPKFSRLVHEWEEPGTARRPAGEEEPN